MADCLYLYKGKQYTFDQLADILAKGELAKLAENDVIDLSKYKDRYKKDSFRQNMKKAEPNKEDLAKEEVKKERQKVVDDLNSALSAAEDNNLDAVVLTLDDEGNLITSFTTAKKGEVEGLVSKAGELHWDIDSINKFAKALNKGLSGNAKSGIPSTKIKMVVADDAAFNKMHETINGYEAPKSTESLYDEKNNLLVINGDVATMTAPIHEAAHIWLKWVEKYNKPLYEIGLDVIKNSETFKQVDNMSQNYKEIYDLEYEKNISEKLSNKDAELKARETALKEVLKSEESKYKKEGMSASKASKEAKKLSVWEDYFFRSMKHEGDKRTSFIAGEILSRAVEDVSSVKFTSKLAETFNNWLDSLYKLLGSKLGFKNKTSDEVKKMTLKDFANSVKEEIVNSEKFSEVVKSTKEKLETKVSKQKAAQENKLETIGLKEDGIAAQAAKKVVEIKMKPITDTRAVNVVKMSNPDFISKFTEALSKTGLIEEQRKLSLNPEATDEDLAETVLGRIMSGELTIPTNAEPIIGKIKGRAPSGLIGEAFKEIADYYNTTPKDVANNIKSIEQQSVEPAKPKESKTSQTKKQANKRTAEQITAEIDNINDKLKKNQINKEEAYAKIEKLTNELMGGEGEFGSQKEKVRPAQGYNDNATFEDTDDGPVYKIGFGRRNEPVDINETKDVVKESNLFKWLTWSKSSLLTAGVDQALAAGKGYMSFYKKQNLFIAQQMLTKGREFIKEWNKSHPDNQIDGAKFSRVMDSALKGDREAFLSLTPQLRDLVENMRSNIDNLSLAKIASGTLTFAEMDTYYENLGTYVANTYGKYSTTYRGNKLLRKALNIFGANTKLDWQKEISEEDKLNAFVAISKEVDNGYADTQEQIDSKTSFVQRRKEVERLQKKAEDKSKEIGEHELNEPADKSTKEWKDWKSKLDKFISTEAKYTKDYQEKLDVYNKAKEKKVKEIYESIVAEMDGNKNYQSVSNKINKAKFEQRKDIPEWYKNLIKQEDDVYKNYFMTVGKLQESNVTTMMQNQILETGLRNGMVVKDEGEFGDSGQPKFKNYIKVGGQEAVTKQGNTKYGPLYGYKMHPDLYKMMFEVPNINLQASSMNNAMKLAGLTGDVILGASNLVNRMKIIYNPSSIMRNFSSHFDSDFKLSGTYWDALTLSTKMIANGKNLFHQGADYYRSKGLATGEQSFIYFKGLAEDAAKYGASETISQNEFDKLYNQVSGEKSMIKAFDRKGTIDPNAPFTSIMDIAAKCVKYAPKALTTLFLKGDYYPKLIHFELRRQNIAYKAYGNDYYSLTPEQQDNCSRSAAANVRQDMAVSDMAGDIANLKFMGIVPKFAYEMQRTFYNAVKNSAGRGIKDQYDFIKWSDNASENEAIIARLNSAHRTRKQIGLMAYTNAIHGMYVIGMALHNKATGKEDKDEEKQTIMHFGQSNDKNSSLYEEIGDWINSDQDNLNPQQAMRAVIPDFLRNHEVYGEYDPQTKKLKYWDAGRNDMYMPAVAPIRGLMYNVNPTQDLNFVKNPALGRGLTTIWDVSQSYVGGTITSNIIMDQALSKEHKREGFFTGLTNVISNALPSDFIAYRKVLEQAKNSETSFVDATGKFFEDTYIKGLQGRYFEVPVDKKIRSNMKVITDSYSEEMKDVIKSINSNITKISGGKNFFEMSNQERYDEMNKPKMKEYIKVAEQQLNETSRKFIKDLRFYYLSAKKFGFTEEEIDELLNKKEMNLLDMGLLKAMPLYRSKDFDGNIKSLLQLKNDEIEQLDFSNLIEDKTYYIDK